jgi:hypothetical protein
MKKTLEVMLVVIMLVSFIGIFVFEEYAEAGEIGRDGRFIAYDNGTVLDTKTNLMWAASGSREVSWHDALLYCNTYRGGGYKNWRMPTEAELRGLFSSDGLPQTTLIKDIGAAWAAEVDYQNERARIVWGVVETITTPGYCSSGWFPWSDVSYLKGNRAFPVRSVK